MLFRSLLLVVSCFSYVISFCQINCESWLKTTSINDEVEVGAISIAGNQLTVEAVVNRTSPYNTSLGYKYAGDIVSKHYDPSDCNYLLRATSAEITTTRGFYSIKANCDIELNKTYHVAMVYDGATLKFYRNGYLMSSVNATGDLKQNSWLTTIGDKSSSFSIPENMVGFINEVRIWNVARTQNELQTYMNDTLPNPNSQTGLKAYYSFNSLVNKQGNPAFNGILKGGALINQQNTSCNFVVDSCGVQQAVVPAFIIPDSVCVNTPFDIVNNTFGECSNFWNFCLPDVNTAPTAVNLGNIGGALHLPVFTDQIFYQGNYYVFVSNNWPGGLVRLDFGNSMLNTPTVVPLGNFGVIPNNLEGIQMVNTGGRWYAILVAGYPNGNVPSRIIKVDFGPDPTNTSPVATNWGNVGNMNYPIDLHLFYEGGKWYGFTVNSMNNTLVRFDFGSDFSNPPTAVNMGNVGNLLYPAGLYAIKDGSDWHLFITNNSDNSSITRLDFGNSLLSTPTATNLGNVGNQLFRPRDIYIMHYCDKTIGFVVNGLSGTIVQLDFEYGLTAVPTAKSLGNLGQLQFPHSLSRPFRIDGDLYSFITNVDNNSITRLKFTGCSNAELPGSRLKEPTGISYSTPGIYNISLTIDDSLPTQAAICKQITVLACTLPLKLSDFTVSLAANNYSTLTFTTYNELDAASISVERAENDLVFSHVGSVALKGDGHYTFADKLISTSGKFYYRLKIVDKTGKVTYSEVRMIILDKDLLARKVKRGGPNQLMIYSPRSEQAVINLLDASGKLIVSKKTFLTVGNNTVEVRTIPNALYFVSVQSKTETSTTLLQLP